METFQSLAPPPNQYIGSFHSIVSREKDEEMMPQRQSLNTSGEMELVEHKTNLQVAKQEAPNGNEFM